MCNGERRITDFKNRTRNGQKLLKGLKEGQDIWNEANKALSIRTVSLGISKLVQFRTSERRNHQLCRAPSQSLQRGLGVDRQRKVTRKGQLTLKESAATRVAIDSMTGRATPESVNADDHSVNLLLAKIFPK